MVAYACSLNYSDAEAKESQIWVQAGQLNETASLNNCVTELWRGQCEDLSSIPSIGAGQGEEVTW